MNKQNIKSILTNARLRLVAATCLILAGVALPTAELARASDGRGGPPGPINTTVLLVPASVCGFPVQETITGRIGVISLPGGSFLVTSPATTDVITNLSNNHSVTINGFTGPAIITFDQNGNTIVRGLGRGAFFDVVQGVFLFLTGEWNFVLDPNGNVIQGPTGNGQITDVCGLIN